MSPRVVISSIREIFSNTGSFFSSGRSSTPKRERLSHPLLLLLPLLLALSAPAALFSEPYTVSTVPNPRESNGGFVSDPDHLLGEAADRINEKLVSFEKETGAEIAVVVLPSIGEEIPKSFAVDLFNTWGIGKKGKDNGLLLLVVMDQKRWEFETGYGMEGLLPDAVLKDIGEGEMVPLFKKGDYGAGVEAGIDAVLNRLHNDTSGDPALNPNAKPGLIPPGVLVIPPEVSIGFSLGTLLYFIILFFYRRSGGKKRRKKKSSGKESSIPPSLSRDSALVFWTKAIFWPLLIWGVLLAGFNFWNSISAYATASVGLLLERIRKDFLLSRVEGDAYHRYGLWRKSHTGLFRFLLFLFPAGMILPYVFYRFRLRSLRTEPRNCPSCSNPLRLLDEKADDQFLGGGRVMEEHLGSVDYDVWLCDKCGHVTILPYENEFTNYTPCPSCKYRTYHVIATRTLVSPTCSSSGSGERDYKCENCGIAKTEAYTIPRRDCSSSSSSSGGGGSSFGGGSSGGGGAGGSW